MTDGIIPEDARHFLLNNIDSIAQWEGLLLLRAQAHTPKDATEIARNLYIAKDDVRILMAPLVARNILVSSETDGETQYDYRPESAELDDLIGRVADLYRQYLIPVTQFIHAKPANSRVQEFANAFRIRKD